MHVLRRSTFKSLQLNQCFTGCTQRLGSLDPNYTIECVAQHSMMVTIPCSTDAKLLWLYDKIFFTMATVVGWEQVWMILLNCPYSARPLTPPPPPLWYKNLAQASL